MMTLLSICSAVVAAGLVSTPKAEVQWSETMTEQTDTYNTFHTTESKVYTWSAAVGNHFVVTGAITYGSWPWRTRFANLASNYWSVSNDYSVYLAADKYVTNTESYYTRTGVNVFVPGQTSSSAMRELDERVTNVLTYVVSDTP